VFNDLIDYNMEKRYNEELEQLIEIALTDGVLTDKKKEVIFKKAQTLGVDIDELEMVLDARVYKMSQQANNVAPVQPETPAEEKEPIISDATKEKIKKGAVTTVKSVGKGSTKLVGDAVTGVATKVGMSLLSKFLIATAVAGVMAAVGYGIHKLIEANKLDILDTPNVVTKIRKIAELNTYTYVDQVVVKDQATTQEISKHLFGSGVDTVDVNHEYVYLIKGIVRAGYDFSKIKEGEIKASNDTLWITLPPVEFLDVISNPSDVEVFYEEKTDIWSYDELQNKKAEARKKIEQNAIERGVIQRAEDAGKEKVTNLFKAFGFNVVEITQK
jgi:hypothetical protein